MPFNLVPKVVIAALVGSAAVHAHGYAHGINVAGVWYEGYNPTTFPFKPSPPTVVGWTISDTNTGFVGPADYASADIICHKMAVPGGGYASVQAGDEVQVYWTPWLSTHHGPVIDYLANCNGNCTTVNKADLEFFKIAGAGMVNDATAPGKWASDTLIANNNSWTVKIPADLAEGNYVWRHEIIALHSAEDNDGAQNYPQCFNLAVTGKGTLAPTGTRGEALYSNNEPGIKLDIYSTLTTYNVPGPTQIAAGTNLVQSELPITGSSPAIPTGVSDSGSSNVVATKSPPAKSTATTSLSAKAPSSTPKTRTPSTTHQKRPSATKSALPTESATAVYPTDKSCKSRPHARGFKL